MSTTANQNAPEPPPAQQPDLPPPSRPTPGTPKPGDPPMQPRPGDPPPSKPSPGSPGPVRPQTVVSWLIISLLAGMALAQEMPQLIDDNDILEAIEAELQFDDAVSANTVDVQVNEGVVELSGTVFTLFAKRRAARLVGSLKGVRSVIDQTKVLASGRTDDQILADVQAALADDPVAEAAEINVEVNSGRVALSGEVDSFAERQLAATTVAGVRGVLGIENKLTSKSNTKRSDSEIKPEIRRRFELSPFLAEGLIEVAVEDGAVMLSGFVGSVNERDLAGLLAMVAGVHGVDTSGVEIKWWLARERRRDKFSVVRNDVQLKHAVEDALLYDSRVHGLEIDVRVRQGAVSLIGDAPSLAAKRAAEQDADNTLGVRRVISHLKVKVPDWPGDRVVTERAAEALSRDSHLADFELRASSHFGKVYLSGDVNTSFEKQRAEAVVANVAGVMDVANRVAVDNPWQFKPDAEIQEDVERRLRWSPVLDVEQIQVSVDEGVVMLRGQVDTRQEQTAASQHARQAGARSVLNQLQVRSRTGNTPKSSESLNRT